MCFSIGKQSQPKLKIIPNKIIFSYSAYKQSKPKKSRKYWFYPVKSKCIVVQSSKVSPKFQILLVLPNQILMNFSSGKKSKPEFSNSNCFTYIQSNTNVILNATKQAKIFKQCMFYLIKSQCIVVQTSKVSKFFKQYLFHQIKP